MTFAATLHDGNPIVIEVSGNGPNILLPVNPFAVQGTQAEKMRKWGSDPELGHSIVKGLNNSYRVIAFDYDGHNLSFPKPDTLTPENVVRDILAIADVTGAERFAYFGYSWLGMIGLQLAIRTDRLSALIVGGFPPIDGPYVELLPFFKAVHSESGAQLKEGETNDPKHPERAKVTVPKDTTKQFVTLFEALQTFDDKAIQSQIKCPKLCFAGSEDKIEHGERWGNVHVSLVAPLINRQSELEHLGWNIRVLDGLNHAQAMQAKVVVPIIRSLLDASC